MLTKRLSASMVAVTLGMAVLVHATPAGASLRGISGLIGFQSARTGTTQIFKSNPDGSAVSTLTQIPSQKLYDVAWSPDGTQAAFSSCCPGGTFQIYIVNADGTGLTQLTTVGRNTLPSWAPGGNRIAFMSARDGNHEIYSMNPDGSNQVDLTNDSSNDENPSWSADGAKISFDSDRSGHFQIYLMTSDGVLLSNISNSTSNDTEPSYSPDGNLIAFQSDRTGNADVYSMNASDGSGQTDLTNNSAGDDRPAWSPDGVKIAFDSDRTGNSEIFTMNADGSEQTNISNNSASDQRPDWQPLLPGTTVVTVSDTGFSPAVSSIGFGGEMEWDFTGTSSHTATDVSSIKLLGSGSMPGGGTYGYPFFAAGLYQLIDNGSGLTGKVKVLVKEDPKTGDQSTTFAISWGSISAPAGLAYDVQIKRPGAGRFVNWLTAQTLPTATFVPDGGSGVYSFRSRLRSTVNGGTTGYSPGSSITVT